MKEQAQNIRDRQFYRFASSKKYIKIHVPDFAFKHDDNNVGKDKFVGRELQIRRLFTWLTSDSKSGSYLITGYRGMGKSLLVKRVIDMISREPKAYKEMMFKVAMILTYVACFIGIAVNKVPGLVSIPKSTIVFVLGFLAITIVSLLEVSKRINQILFQYNFHKVPFHHILDKNMIAKFWLKNKDRRNRKYSNIAITVNLGQEVLNERDVLSLIAHSVREKYYKFVHNRQNRPFTNYICILATMLLSFIVVQSFILPIFKEICNYICFYSNSEKSWISSLIVNVVCFFEDIAHNPDRKWVYCAFLFVFCLLFYYWTVILIKAIRRKIPYFSTPYKSLERLDILCERVASSLNEEKGTHPQYSSSFFNFSFGKAGKSKSTPIATVRELEQELMGIVNNINGEDCPYGYCAQFIIVFDELDKIANVRKKGNLEMDDVNEETSPVFDTSVRGFTDAMAYEERKEKVLRLLANMKLFITSVKAKCVFISGHELFDASLADLSDREFAISSIFNGVLNVSSFLSPEREESDVSSMTEVYLATMLLPETYLKNKLQNGVPKSSMAQIRSYITKRSNERITRVISFWPRLWPKSYLKQKVGNGILNNGILKDELPSLRWYNEYLMDVHILNNKATLTNDELKEREDEICHAIEFLRCFCVYLSQISNGSPKKIATYFEKYVKVNFDTIKQFDWYDEIEVGQPTEDDVRKQCVLYFDSDAQRLINFIHYLAAPVMNAITNEVSHYGDKLLVSSSFMLDQIYKYHGNGFSWRNLEQMPELLNTNKNPELRDSMASIMEFLLQTHITTIPSGIFQYKFHKQIAEEISMLSKTSEEAAAIFNFTLNETETVKRYNTRLLWTYLNLSNQAKDESQKERYCNVLERLHENQGDIYFSEEDYYRAIHEYRSALQYINEKKITPRNLIAYLKCSLKVGMSYEYRRTFENAYMVYCQIINNLVQLRWMDEKKFGLDYTMRLTHDWRVKQTVLVNAKSLKVWFSSNDNKKIRKQFKPGLLEDLRTINDTFKPEFSIDADKTISSLAKNFTPEKSDLFLRLTAFEDVKFIYQAIIAKLFVIEKMESSGITQSSIDAAEAEFMTLYSTTNYNEKYLLAADFFSKLAGILYYKNTIVSSESPDNIFTSLYLFDIDLLALIDDYCFKVCKNTNSYDAIQIKDDIRLFLSVIQTVELRALWTVDFKYTKDLFYAILWISGYIKEDDLNSLLSTIRTTEQISIRKTGSKYIKDLFYAALLSSNVCKKLFDFCNEGKRLEGMLKNTFEFFNYLDLHKYGNIGNKWNRSMACFNRREYLSEKGCKLPCTACKYANRSMTILMQQLFGYNETVDSRAFTLLSNTSHAKLKVLRPEILSQLASSSEQLADIMMSCAFTTPEKRDDENIVVLGPKPDNISTETIDLLVILTMNDLKETEREKAIMTFKTKNQNREHIGKLNRAIIYYWAACRYYDIASMHHEAVHCIWRITRVIENYLTVLSDVKSRIKDASLPDFFEENNLDKLTQLLEQLFVLATRIVGRQHNNYDSVEIHELKWLFHLELVDDIDLTRLTLFPDLQSIFLSIINCKILVSQIMPNFRLKKWQLDYDCRNKTKDKTKCTVKYKCVGEMNIEEYISKMYLKFSGQRHERTFKSDVELNYFKAKMNHIIFCDLLGRYDVKEQFLYKENDIKYYYPDFYSQLKRFVENKRTKHNNEKELIEYYENELFKLKDNTVQSKLDLLDFLIYDSIVCLCNIINALPPHNQFSTFSNSFIANVYEDIWAWSKYYEVMYNMYLYYRYYQSGDESGMEKMMRYYPETSGENRKRHYEKYRKLMQKYAEMLKNNGVVCKDDFGFRYSKLFMSIRHDMDDATIHHIFCNYSAEMAIKYYRAARGINSEGQEYKNMINNMYVLDDDLRNDTCQSNLADERYLQNSGIIEKKRKAMQQLYVKSRANRLSSYESDNNPTMEYQQLQERFADSIYTNTEY